MKLLLHFAHYPVCLGRYMVDAFRRLGHEVYHDGPAMGRFVWNLALPPKLAYAPEPAPEGWEPDLCVLMDTAYQWHHPTVPTVVYTADNHVRDVRQDGITHYFVGHKAVSMMPWQADMTWLPCAYDPVAFKPSAIPWAERKWDVAMLGVLYPQRVAMVGALRKAGLKVIAGAGLVYESYAQVYQDARVSLCISACGDVGQRVFETAAMGCAVVSDPCKDMAALAVRGMQIVTDVEYVVEACRADHLEQAAKFQQEWALPNTWQARAETIIQWAKDNIIHD